ncbi:aldehyde-activating protein [Comamonas serinivorans]|uniref:Aldehyde-activating protein n=1 Tax=Comamonas serinivorans TaxID=1082851 RepID=A0A1Y0ELC6_9BURK|nr:GFA family protein [Comamonas serinivorans]ARU04218.1 aldehyde-activating protein [Comamonas serinivorans]
MYTASCLCGAIALEIDAAIDAVQLCHCRECQKAQGGAFVAVAPVPRDALRLVRGADQLASYSASPGKRRVFCRDCGSPVYSERLDAPQTVRLRVGLIDGPLAAPVDGHAFTREQVCWFHIGDDAPRHEGPRPV